MRSRPERPFQRGDFKYIILHFLKEKPSYGYEIMRGLQEQFHSFYVPSPGSIYPTLQMLEEMGYAQATEQDGKKIYAITEQGLEFLEKRNDLADGIRSRMKHRWSFKNIGRMALVMKEYHALEHLLGQGFRGLNAEKAQRIREILVRAYDDIESIIHE